MKKKLTVLLASLAALVVLAAPAAPAMAACSGSDGDSRETALRPKLDENGNQVYDENGNPVYEEYHTENDYLLKEAGDFDGPIDADNNGTVDQSGTILYGAFNDSSDGGYIGIVGSVGYIELSGDGSEGWAQIDGSESGGNLDGRITVSTSPEICINGQP